MMDGDVLEIFGRFLILEIFMIVVGTDFLGGYIWTE